MLKASQAAIPMTARKMPQIRPNGQMTFLTPMETPGVLNAAKQRSIQNWAMIPISLLAWLAGYRRSAV
jgi:hypothetical protein